MKPGLNSQYVFLVDDEPIQNEMLRDHLSDHFGFQFKVYDSGEGAIKDMNLNPRIVVLDYHLNAHLPNAQNGVEVLKAIKKSWPNVKVVMLSGQDKLEVAVQSMKLGATEYVIKGETAFSRMVTVFNKILDLEDAYAENKQYKRTLYAIYGFFTCLVLYTLYRLYVDKIRMQ